MEFNEKLQGLRKERGLTQDELAKELYVSRTAISKWESGRGYPSIDSLKEIAKFFGVTVDELLSSGEVISIAEENNRQTRMHFCDLAFGLLDISALMLFFLPLFGQSADGVIESVSLLSLNGVQLWLKIAYFAVVTTLAIFGVLTLALQNCTARAWRTCKSGASLVLGVLAVLLFILSRMPYAAALLFIFLTVKTLILIKCR